MEAFHGALLSFSFLSFVILCSGIALSQPRNVGYLSKYVKKAKPDQIMNNAPRNVKNNFVPQSRNGRMVNNLNRVSQPRNGRMVNNLNRVQQSGNGRTKNNQNKANKRKRYLWLGYEGAVHMGYQDNNRKAEKSNASPGLPKGYETLNPPPSQTRNNQRNNLSKKRRRPKEGRRSNKIGLEYLSGVQYSPPSFSGNVQNGYQGNMQMSGLSVGQTFQSIGNPTGTRYRMSGDVGMKPKQPKEQSYQADVKKVPTQGQESKSYLGETVDKAYQMSAKEFQGPESKSYLGETVDKAYQMGAKEFQGNPEHEKIIGMYHRALNVAESQKHVNSLVPEHIRPAKEKASMSILKRTKELLHVLLESIKGKTKKRPNKNTKDVPLTGKQQKDKEVAKSGTLTGIKTGTDSAWKSGSLLSRPDVLAVNSPSTGAQSKDLKSVVRGLSTGNVGLEQRNQGRIGFGKTQKPLVDNKPKRKVGLLPAIRGQKSKQKYGLRNEPKTVKSRAIVNQKVALKSETVNKPLGQTDIKAAKELGLNLDRPGSNFGGNIRKQPEKPTLPGSRTGGQKSEVMIGSKMKQSNGYNNANSQKSFSTVDVASKINNKNIPKRTPQTENWNHPEQQRKYPNIPYSSEGATQVNAPKISFSMELGHFHMNKKSSAEPKDNSKKEEPQNEHTIGLHGGFMGFNNNRHNVVLYVDPEQKQMSNSLPGHQKEAPVYL